LQRRSESDRAWRQLWMADGARRARRPAVPRSAARQRTCRNVGAFGRDVRDEVRAAPGILPVRDAPRPAPAPRRVRSGRAHGPVSGEAADIPVIFDDQDLKRAKNALSSLAGELGGDKRALERYKIVNELIVEFQNSEEALREELSPSSNHASVQRPSPRVVDYPDGQEWKQKARCYGADPGIFTSTVAEDEAKAKSICRTCCVQDSCLSYALLENEDFGTWGGATEKERRTIKRKRQRTAASKQAEETNEAIAG